MRTKFHNSSLLRRLLFSLSAIASLPLLSADIPAWRNTNNGLFPDAQPPIDWEGSQLYNTPLDATSNGTPILVKGKLYLTSEPSNLICADSKTGEILWSRSNSLEDILELNEEDRELISEHMEKLDDVDREIQRLRNDTRRIERTLRRDPDNEVAKRSLEEKEGQTQAFRREANALRKNPALKGSIPPDAHGTNGYSSYSPLSDGERIFAVFGIGVVVAYDLDGSLLWRKRLEDPDHKWGGSTMPRLVDGKLIVRFSNFTALNPDNGDKIWSTPSVVQFGTPTPFEVENQSYLFTSRGEVIRVSDGKMVQSGLVTIDKVKPWSIMNTPTRIGDMLYTVNGAEGTLGTANAFRIPKDLATLESQGLENVWTTEVVKDRYYASSLIHDGLMYIASRESHLSVLDAGTGEIIYTKKIGGSRGTVYPSLTEAGGKLFLGVEDGTLAVFKLGRQFEELARNKLPAFRSTPIFSGEFAYLRTFDGLLAVKK